MSAGVTGHVPIYCWQFDTAFRSAGSRLEFEQRRADGQSVQARAIYDAQRRSNLSMTEWMGLPTSRRGGVEVTASFAGSRSVWLRDDLAPDLPLALAGLGSALMLQPR